MDRRAVGALVIGVLEDELAPLEHQRTAERDLLADVYANARDAMPQPHGGHRSRLVADGRAQFAQPAREGLDVQALESADDGSFGLEEQLRYGRRWLEGLVAQRKMEQQVFDRVDPEAAVQSGAHGANALEGL